jgi:acetyl esterase
VTHARALTMSNIFTLPASRWLFSLMVCTMTASAQQPPTPARLAFEPATAAFVEEIGRQPPTEGLTLEQLREGYRQTVIKNSVPADLSVAVRNDTVAGPAGAVPVRLYTPQTAVGKISGLLLYVHGGGFAVGDLDSHDRLLRLIASELGHRVLALEYRRAPENPYPAALDDVVAVYRWVQAQARSLQVDPQRLALGGESAGGTHATAAAMAVRDRQLSPLRALWVMVPALDAQTRGASYTTFATGAGRTATEFAYLWSLYVPDAAQRGLPGPSPLYASAAGLPKTFVYTAEFDPARDDGESFANKVEAAGGQVTRLRHKGLVHQFPEITGLSPASRQAVVDAARALAEQLR